MEFLTPEERERLIDISLKIQSVRESLTKVARHKISGMKEISECLLSADRQVRTALGYMGPQGPVSHA
jgi:hypothetical protein